MITVTIQHTHEQIHQDGYVTDSIDLVIEAIVSSFGLPAQTYGPAENCCPAEPPVVELGRVWVDYGAGKRDLIAPGRMGDDALLVIAADVADDRLDDILTEAALAARVMAGLEDKF